LFSGTNFNISTIGAFFVFVYVLPKMKLTIFGSCATPVEPSPWLFQKKKKRGHVSKIRSGGIHFVLDWAA
jgi:hypothetical protein